MDTDALELIHIFAGMKKIAPLALIGIIGLSACNSNQEDDTLVNFDLNKDMQVAVQLSGEVHDTIYDVDAPNRTISYEAGYNKLKGVLTISSANDNSGNYTGSIRWEQRIYVGEKMTRTFNPGTATWDTTYSNTNVTESFPDSSIIVEGAVHANRFNIHRFVNAGEDAQPVLRTRTGLDFTTLKQTATVLKGYAGYPEIETTYIADPDSAQFQYFYRRDIWSLDTITWRKN